MYKSKIIYFFIHVNLNIAILTINITFDMAKRYFLENFSRFSHEVLFSEWLSERYNYPNVNNSIAYMINRCRRSAKLSVCFAFPFLHL